MRTYLPYVEALRAIVAARGAQADASRQQRVADALDGEASANLRALVSLSKRKAAGAFFTPSGLARAALHGVLPSIGASSVVLDPACGAGDLLLPVLSHLLKGPSRGDRDWVDRIRGIDKQPLFIDAARLRLALLSGTCGVPRAPSAVRGVAVGDALRSGARIEEATHIVLNPPYRLMTVRDVGWADGSVNSAAVFLMHCLEHATPGARLVAVLPDVLRTGSRYDRWRRRLESLATVESLSKHGRFDTWTDIDVFSIRLVIRRRNLRRRRVVQWTNQTSDARIGDFFAVHVGSVVNFRDPRTGPRVPYLTAREAPGWGEVRSINTKRRFSGRLVTPPVVVVRRTSSPADGTRGVATVVRGSEPIAVDNHLLVLAPKGQRDIEELVEVLRQPATTAWLNQRIRCRHLTVGAVAQIPWIHDAART